MLVPFLPWMALATWLGVYARRIHRPLTRRLGGRVGLSATLTVSLLIVVAIPIVAVTTSIVVDAIALVRRLVASQEAQVVLVKLVEGGGTNGSNGGGGAIDLVMAQGDRAWQLIQDLAGAAARFAIGLLILVTGMYGVLVEGDAWYRWLERYLPLDPAYLRRFADAFVETGRGLWWGIIGAGLLQAIVATIAYVVIGVPSALALGMLTLLVSVIPAIGTALVWVPVSAGLAITGRPVAAIALAITGVAVIGTIDNLARPWLAHRGRLALPTWMVLVAMFGGIEVVGPWGLLLGPLAIRLAKEALLIASERRNPASSGQAVETPDAS